MKRLPVFIILLALAIILIFSYKALTNKTNLAYNSNSTMSTDNSVVPVTDNVSAVQGISTIKVAEPVAKLTTSFGVIEIQLFEDTMPVTAGNFDKLVPRDFIMVLFSIGLSLDL